MTQTQLREAGKPHHIGIKSLREAADALGVLLPPPGHVGLWRLPEEPKQAEQGAPLDGQQQRTEQPRRK